MKTFKQFINEQKEYLIMGDTKKAYDMERVIVSAAGGEKFVSDLIPNSEKVGKKIINNLKLTGKSYFPKNSYPATDKWAKYFLPDKPKGSTLTPKTDFIIGNKKISLKTGDAVLMSGERKEATATFYNAMDNTKTLDDAVKRLKKHIDNMLPSTDMTKYNIKGNKTQLSKAGKFAEIEILKKADEAHKAFKKDMRDVFINSEGFGREFTFEAMTGKIKFGDNDGTANHFLVTDYDGNATLHKVTKSSDEYVSKIMKYVKPDATFKTTQKKSAKLVSPSNKKGGTGYYTFWSALKVGVKMIQEEEIKNADLLNESIFDIIKRTFKKAINWIKSFFKKIYSFVSKSYKSLMEFMVIEPVVKYNNMVKW